MIKTAKSRCVRNFQNIWNFLYIFFEWLNKLWILISPSIFINASISPFLFQCIVTKHLLCTRCVLAYRELGVNRCKLLLLEWIYNEILLCRTLTMSRYLLCNMTMGGKIMYTCMYNLVPVLYSEKINK